MRLPWVARATAEAARLAEVKADLCAAVRDRQAGDLHAQVALAQAHDEWAGRLQQLIAQHAAEMAAERQRHADLVAQLIELRREGFSPPAASGVVTPLRTLDQAVTNAIAQVAEPGSALEAECARWAERELARGRSPEQIAADIVRGGEIEDEAVA